MLQHQGVSGGCRGNMGMKDSVNKIDKERVRKKDCF